MKAYHFSGAKLRDGRPLPAIGTWLEHKGPVVPCKSGLHASRHPFDALQYAPGLMLHRIELKGDLTPHGDPVDKYVGRRRKILATIDATDLLRAFFRQSAARAAAREAATLKQRRRFARMVNAAFRKASK